MSDVERKMAEFIIGICNNQSACSIGDCNIEECNNVFGEGCPSVLTPEQVVEKFKEYDNQRM